MSNFRALLPGVTTFIFDYDGVMTDGSVYMDANGEPLRTSNVKDGYALQLATKMGFNIAIISGAFCPSIIPRMNALGVTNVFIGVPDKIVALEKYMEQKDILPSQIVYMGDDIPDYRVMKRVGVPVCPADAVDEIKNISVYISDRNGGRGCVRDIIEQTLRVQDKWMTDESHIW
jgi:3-deoxy-D-manno-octulosonate 8-phosphate phosphatase, YrbI family